MIRTVAMIGEGAWGTAVATLLARNGYCVQLWCQDPQVAHAITTTRINSRYLPEIHLDEKICAVTDIKDALCGAEWVFEAIPVKYLRSVLIQAKQYVTPQQVWVVLSKGIEIDTLLLPTQIIDDVYGSEVKKAVFAGPSYAYEVATEQMTAVTIGATDCDVGLALQKMVGNAYFRSYVTLDMIGVQVGAALKNVITLGIGMLDGAGYNDNIKAYFITRGLAEMAQLTTLMGGRKDTMYGLSGLGDLVLTSMGRLSRNLEVGRQLGKGCILADILHQTGYIPEGINTVQAVHQLATQFNSNLFICNRIFRVVFEGMSIATMLHDIMARPLEWEC